ncbi:DNA ligase (ATP) [Strigomonas culicis]|uniref:DNA ligase (ATP) n=1 Tax=Strigomonas culicis TaxID=28005 RepID=S9V7D3_9TRYP|nr:DNA ligase (ATP) [Strigomonas culicis]|eukprot:EPY18850.1 DNA ligase (ATP) [Strigomonas culicis]
MHRLTRCLRLSLPFEPMALTTVEALQKRMALYGVHPQPHGSSGGDAPAAVAQRDLAPGGRPCRGTAPAASRRAQAQHDLHWFAGESLFFVSPKFDGIRLVSYVAPPPPSAAGAGLVGRKRAAAKDGKGRGGASCEAHHLFYVSTAATPATFTSCFSRYGRPIYGAFWLEKELALLRFLSRDPYLALDGEFYIHKNAARAPRGGKGKGAAAKPKVRQEAEEEKGSFNTGFLAVNALVHRLRGSKSACATRADILQYVDCLPTYCVFDIPSYSPPPPAAASPPSRRHAPYEHGSVEQHLMETHPRGRQLLAERDRVWAAVGKAQHVRDAELLRCTPNVTPFTQRVRTLHFLMALLAHGVASPLLRGAFALEDDAVARPKRARRGGGRPLGGTFVTPVPYALITTVEEAKTQLLPEFVRAGYEGAVVRTPMNVYEMREKRKGTVRALCRGLAAQSAASPRARGVPQEQHLRFTDASLAEALLEAQEAGAVAALAERRVRALAPRAYTAVKILPFLDQEFAVLRALFKEPSVTPARASW